MNLINKYKTYAIYTLGCKVNTYESNIIKNELDSYGFINVPFENQSDIYVINTCSVTNNADAKSRNIINRAKKTNPNALIIVCGCYSQVASETLRKNFGIDILIGNKYKNNIVELINQYLAHNNKSNPLVKIDNLLLETKFEESSIDVYKNNTRAFVKIQDGCNFMCSYCIIPFARGRQRSKNINLIIDEIKTLVNNNYKEIVLTGVNTAGYQFENYSFYDLLSLINSLEGNFRIRISSVEPFQINDQIINLICNNPNRFCQHWHICLQSGNDRILKLMNRKYTKDEFKALVNKIYKLNSFSSITTDYICGFPTETNQDYFESIKFIESIKFSKLHVFPYSKRNFTPAANFEQIDNKVISNRVNEMLKLSDKLNIEYIKKLKSNDLYVLIEEQVDQTRYRGYSSEYIDVIVESNENIINKMCLVQIKHIFNNLVVAKLVKILY